MNDKNQPVRSKEPEISQECLDKDIPIKLSMAGFSSYYHHCDIYGGRSNYAVCQHTIDAVTEQRVQLRSECQAAVENGTCPAIQMRKQEQVAGKALFFSDRRESLKRLDEQIKAPSTVVQYRKGGPASGQPLNTRRVTNDEARAFGEGLADKNTKLAKKADEPINVDLAGRSLLGDAIDNMMKEHKE